MKELYHCFITTSLPRLSKAQSRVALDWAAILSVALLFLVGTLSSAWGGTPLVTKKLTPPCALTVSITTTPAWAGTGSSLTIPQGQSATLTASGADNYTWSTGETTAAISVSTAGTYSVTGTTGACSATASVSANLAQPVADGPACDNYVTKTTDNGLGDNYVLSVHAVSGPVPSTPGSTTVYAATQNGVSISTDGGKTYTNHTTGLGSPFVSKVHVVGHTIYAATDGGLSISTDGGNTWVNKTTADGLSGDNVFAVYATGNTVYAGVNNSTSQASLNISTDGGNTWVNKTSADGLTDNPIYDVYAEGNMVYVSSFGGGLSISTDGGNTFINKTDIDGLGSPAVFGVYAQGNTIYAATLFGLSISTDGGATWITKTDADGLADISILGVYAQGNTIYAATLNGLSISTDGGTTWVSKTTENGLGSNFTLSVSVAGDRVYVGTGDGGVSFCDASCSLTVGITPVPSGSPAALTINQGQSITLTASGADTYVWSTGETSASITVSPDNTRMYSVTGTTGDCYAKASVVVTVNRLTLIPNVNTTPVCLPANTTLSVDVSGGTGPYTYAWVAPAGTTFTGNGTSTISAVLNTAGVQTFTVTVAGGGLVATTTVSVYAIAIPQPVLSTSPVCTVINVAGAENAIALDWYKDGSFISRQLATYPTNGQVIGNGAGCTCNPDLLSYPEYITTDAAGYIYTSDPYNNRVVKFAPNSTSATIGIVVAGGNGDGDNANQLSSPAGVFVDKGGNLYVADFYNNRVQKFPAGSTADTPGITVAGGNDSGDALDQLDNPLSIFVDGSGYLYVGDNYNNRVVKFPPGSTSATLGTIVAGGNGVGDALNQFDLATGLWVTPAGELYVSDLTNNRILKFPAGSTQATDGTVVAGGNGYGNALNQFDGPVAIQVDVLGNLYVADEGNMRVLFFPAGSTSATEGTIIAGNGELGDFEGLTLDSEGILYVADGEHSRLLKYVPTVPTSFTTTSAGNYTVKVTNAAGCVGTSAPLSVGSPITVDIIATPYLTIPSGGTATLTASGATSYVWSTSATTASISTNTGGIYSVTGTTGGCSATASVILTGSDLSPVLVLPQANFAAAGSVNNFLVSLFEVKGLPTALGQVAITITAPMGYTLAFDNTLTSIQVTGSIANPAVVSNTNWTVSNTVYDRQISLMIKPGQSIAAGSTMNLGFSITRTTANSGSTSSITVNITDDATKAYDGYPANNVYARVISGL